MNEKESGIWTRYYSLRAIARRVVVGMISIAILLPLTLAVAPLLWEGVEKVVYGTVMFSVLFIPVIIFASLILTKVFRWPYEK